MNGKSESGENAGTVGGACETARLGGNLQTARGGGKGGSVGNMKGFEFILKP